MTEQQVHRLSHLIGRVIDETEDADPSVIARRVLMHMDESDVYAHVAELLRDRVRIELGRRRMMSRRSPTTSRWERLTAEADQRLCIDGTWKRQADCTPEDFDWLAGDQQNRAERHLAMASHYAGVAQQMRSAGAETFADLLRVSEVAA